MVVKRSRSCWGAGSGVLGPGWCSLGAKGGLHPLDSPPTSLGLGVWAPGGAGSVPAPPGLWGPCRGSRGSGSEGADVAPHGGYRPRVLLRGWSPRGRGVRVGLAVTVRWGEQGRLLRGYRNRARVVQDRASAAARGGLARGPGSGSTAATGDPRTGHGGCYRGFQNRMQRLLRGHRERGHRDRTQQLFRIHRDRSRRLLRGTLGPDTAAANRDTSPGHGGRSRSRRLLGRPHPGAHPPFL